MIAINLQQLRKVIYDFCCWAFSIAFDAAKNREDVYLDVRLQVAARKGVSIVHFAVIPLQNRCTGLLLFQVVSQILEAVFRTCWKEKLISVVTDGAKNMNGRVQGAVKGF